MHLSTLLLGFMYFAVVQEPLGLPNAVILENCRINLNDQVEVPAQEAGVLKKIFVKEGDNVKLGDKLVQIDDSIPKKQVEVAEANLLAAKEQANNDVPRRYAEKGLEVAKAEYETALDSNKRVPGTVVQVKLNELYLKCQEMVLSIEKAKMDKIVAERQADVKQAEKDAAITSLEHRLLLSSVDGQVREIRRHVGEWAQMGETVLQIVQMDILRSEGVLKASEYSPSEILGKPVVVEVKLARGRVEKFSGQIVFADPQIRPGNGTYVVRAEVKNRQENDQWLLRPGMSATMTIQLK